MCADFLDLGKEIRIFEESKIPMIHVDVMDGHYVPNFTLGPDICAAVASTTHIPLDIHLMIDNVDAYVPVFAKFDSPWISFHPEAVWHPLRTASLIRSCGARAGIALDPSMPIERFKYLLPEVDLVCVMTVNPGYAGQTLIPAMLGKIAGSRIPRPRKSRSSARGGRQRKLGQHPKDAGGGGGRPRGRILLALLSRGSERNIDAQNHGSARLLFERSLLS